MSRSRRTTSQRVKLSELTEEEIREFMDSVESDDDDGDFSSDDSMVDPTFEPDDISPEDEDAIDRCLQNLENTDMFIAQAVNLSLNLSSLDAPSASSTLMPGIDKHFLVFFHSLSHFRFKFHLSSS